MSQRWVLLAVSLRREKASASGTKPSSQVWCSFVGNVTLYVCRRTWMRKTYEYIYIYTHKNTAHIGRIVVNVTDLWWLCHSVFLCTGVSQCTFTIQENPNQLMTHYWKELANDAKYTQCFIRSIFWCFLFPLSLQYRSKGRPCILLQAHFSTSFLLVHLKD